MEKKLNVTEMARHLGICVRTLRRRIANARKSGAWDTEVFPVPCERHSQMILWRQADIDAWMRQASTENFHKSHDFDTVVTVYSRGEYTIHEIERSDAHGNFLLRHWRVFFKGTKLGARRSFQSLDGAKNCATIHAKVHGILLPSRWEKEKRR